jgi:hypothetical protein
MYRFTGCNISCMDQNVSRTSDYCFLFRAIAWFVRYEPSFRRALLCPSSLLYQENIGRYLLRNFGTYLPDLTASYTRRGILYVRQLKYTFFTLDMEDKVCSEMLVLTHQVARRHITE